MADYLLIFRLNMEDTELNEENTKPFKNAHNKQTNKWTNIEKTQQKNTQEEINSELTISV